MRYIHTRPNGDALRKCILKGPYTLSTVTILGQPVTNDSPAVKEQTVLKTLSNISPLNKAHYDAEKEAIHLLLTRIGDKIYSIVDYARQLMRCGSPLKSYNTYQNEVIGIHAKKIAKNANPLALVVAAQQYPNTYYQAPKSHKSYTPPSKQSSSTKSYATTRYKGKEIAKPITPPSETSSNTRNKNVDTSLRYKNDNHVVQFGNQRTVTIVGARETVEQADWIEDTDEEVNEQELEAHYMYMAKIQEVHTIDSRPSFDAEILEK
nr:hypothetical protein [Tanacetum cinerariifolium]